MKKALAALALTLALAACQPVQPPALPPLGQEPQLDPHLVYDEDPGMACFPTDVRTGELVDVCVWGEAG